MQWMKKEGIVIWLDESMEVLVERLIKEKEHRPLIAKLNEKQIGTFLEEQLTNRLSFYQQANYRVSSAQITESELKKIILKHAS
jgi:shikimate kinase